MFAAIERLHRQGLSQRVIAEETGVSRPTIIAYLKKTFRPIGATLMPILDRPELELDELWSYVGHKGQVVWIWIALERRSRRIVGLAFGDCSAETARALWDSLPADYRRHAICYSDEYEPYQLVLPPARHRPLRKSSGATSHIG